MCLTCSCGLPDEDWGDPDNITVDTIKRAVKTLEGRGLTTNDAVKELLYTWQHKTAAQDKTYLPPSVAHTLKTIGHKIRLLMEAGQSKSEAHKIASGEVAGDSGVKAYMRKVIR